MLDFVCSWNMLYIIFPYVWHVSIIIIIISCKVEYRKLPTFSIKLRCLPLTRLISKEVLHVLLFYNLKIYNLILSIAYFISALYNIFIWLSNFCVLDWSFMCLYVRLINHLYKKSMNIQGELQKKQCFTVLWNNQEKNIYLSSPLYTSLFQQL